MVNIMNTEKDVTPRIPTKVPHFMDFTEIKDDCDCFYCKEKKKVIKNVFITEEKMEEFKFYWEMINQENSYDVMENNEDAAYVMETFVAPKYDFFRSIDVRELKKKIPLQKRFMCEHCFYGFVEKSSKFGWNYFESIISFLNKKVDKNIPQ